MIFGMVEIPYVPIEPDMPPATTRDDVRVEEVANPESKAETDKEMLEVAEQTSYEGLMENEEVMVDTVVQTSLANAPLAAPSGSDTVDVTSGTKTQVQSVLHRALMPR
ncbi:hypothetical protein H5410_001961 [Solanum commersonii]|uniref:Polyprotein protein n=1 Tax=Solanum commersonii TaxID=4109 RepID=A0A9J6B0Q2_SOLCO|nr:hypothetical protein H5410_001961 [Solanum commersonii]